MSGKACGARESGERPQFMLGSNFLNRQSNTNTTNQIVAAIRETRNATRLLQNKTEQIEQSLLMQRSVNQVQSNVNVGAIEKKFQQKLDLVSGDFKQQMKTLKDYIKVLEQKIQNLENAIVKKTPVIPKKQDSNQKINKKTETKEEPKKQKKEEKEFSKKKDKKGKVNVTLEIKEK